LFVLFKKLNKNKLKLQLKKPQKSNALVFQLLLPSFFFFFTWYKFFFFLFIITQATRTKKQASFL